jgi:hypothetical protein
LGHRGNRAQVVTHHVTDRRDGGFIGEGKDVIPVSADLTIGVGRSVSNGYFHARPRLGNTEQARRALTAGETESIHALVSKHGGVGKACAKRQILTVATSAVPPKSNVSKRYL